MGGGKAQSLVEGSASSAGVAGSWVAGAERSAAPESWVPRGFRGIADVTRHEVLPGNPAMKFCRPITERRLATVCDSQADDAFATELRGR